MQTKLKNTKTKREEHRSSSSYYVYYFKELVVIIIPKNVEIQLDLSSCSGKVAKIVDTKLQTVQIKADNLEELVKMASSVSLCDNSTFKLLLKLQDDL